MLTNDETNLIINSFENKQPLCFYGVTIITKLVNNRTVLPIYYNETPDVCMFYPKHLIKDYYISKKISDLFPLFEWFKLCNIAISAINKPVVYKFQDYVIVAKNNDDNGLMPQELEIHHPSGGHIKICVACGDNGEHVINSPIDIDGIYCEKCDKSYHRIIMTHIDNSYPHCYFHLLLKWLDTTPVQKLWDYFTDSEKEKVDTTLLTDINISHDKLSDKFITIQNEISNLNKQMQELELKIDMKKTEMTTTRDQIVLYDRIIAQLKKK